MSLFGLVQFSFQGTQGENVNQQTMHDDATCPSKSTSKVPNFRMLRSGKTCDFKFSPTKQVRLVDVNQLGSMCISPKKKMLQNEKILGFQFQIL